MHPFPNLVATALQHHSVRLSEVDADVCSVEFLLHNERRISKERLGLSPSEMLVVVGPARPKKMGRARILDKIVAGSTHVEVICFTPTPTCGLWRGKIAGERAFTKIKSFACR